MLFNYIKIALKVLTRRKFFTAISLFGIWVTLTMALVIASVNDHGLSASSPEVNLDRTLHISHMAGKYVRDKQTATWQGSVGYPILDRYCKELPGVEKMSIYAENVQVTSFIEDHKAIFDLKYTDGAYWEILDFEFIEGGPFTHADEAQGNLVAVISDATRQQLFAGQPALDRFFVAGGQRFRVVGVVPKVDFLRLSALADIWVPHATRKSQEFRHQALGGFFALLLARSSDDFPAIKEEFKSRMAHLVVPENYDEVEIKGEPRTRLEQMAGWTGDEHDASIPSIQRLFWGISGGLLLWLLLPTLNLISINMSRIIERSPEIGVRKAFGASSSHLIGQFILENVILCLIGGVLAFFGSALIIKLTVQAGLSPYTEVPLNFRVGLYAVGLACLFGVISGALPAWKMSRLHPVDALRGGAR
jgi:putative ABC transport system permease protein